MSVQEEVLVKTRIKGRGYHNCRLKSNKHLHSQSHFCLKPFSKDLTLPTNESFSNFTSQNSGSSNLSIFYERATLIDRIWIYNIVNLGHLSAPPGPANPLLSSACVPSLPSILRLRPCDLWRMSGCPWYLRCSQKYPMSWTGSLTHCQWIKDVSARENSCAFCSDLFFMFTLCGAMQC